MASNIQASCKNEDGTIQNYGFENRNPAQYKRGIDIAPGIKAVLIGLGAVLVGTGVTGILIGKQVIPVDVNQLNLFFGGGIGLTAVGAVSISSAFFGKGHMKSIKHVSFNVGTAGDWTNLIARRYLMNTTSDPITERMIAEKIQGTDPATEFEMKNLARQNAVIEHKEKAETQFGKILREFDPDVISLQEYFDVEEKSHEAIKNLLLDHGYEIAAHHGRRGIQDLAIAYKADQFDAIYGSMTGDHGEYPALFIDLKDKKTGTVVRAWTDHVQGFNVENQKAATDRRKLQPNYEKTTLKVTLQEREAVRRKEQDTKRSASGDSNFDRNLNGLESDPMMPHLILGGTDANSTIKSDLNPAHPKRVRLATDIYGHTTDTQDQNPTIVDANDRKHRKYDYSFVKVTNLPATATIQSIVMNGVNDVSMLDPRNNPMSDHLPVLSVVTLKRKWFYLPKINA